MCQQVLQEPRPEDTVGFLMWHITLLRQKHINQILKPLDLTHFQLLLLATLKRVAREPGALPLTQVQLAEHTRTDLTMNSQVLRGLEKRGLVRRFPHPVDSRAKGVELTPAGEALIAQAVPLIKASDSKFFVFDADEEAQFKRLLTKIYHHHRESQD